MASSGNQLDSFRLLAKQSFFQFLKWTELCPRPQCCFFCWGLSPLKPPSRTGSLSCLLLKQTSGACLPLRLLDAAFPQSNSVCTVIMLITSCCSPASVSPHTPPAASLRKVSALLSTAHLGTLYLQA
jgi:hypothetical protein